MRTVQIKIVHFYRNEIILSLCASEGIHDYPDQMIEMTSEDRIFASSNNFEKAESEFSAKRFGSSYSCTLPLDNTRILYKQESSYIHQII